MLGRGVRPCLGALWSVVSGTVIFWAGSGASRYLDGSEVPPLVQIREIPEFHDLVRMDKGHWPRCLLWHGWLPMLFGVHGACPWAADASESDGHLLEVALGSYFFWVCPAVKYS